ncbi:flagellin [sulfur-oxidizing endosymbiont of Gigantopelta aegis]|uniref:flagellin N-terminal helical domain-containing protein n=1 Tax=sulfur-oxidizing endosymbiont of Gigantopelta aegis TaxID=2794934 RepID=UPI0018DE823A|nr:flagellin [sulfur-oxidizing endosymbiont of Gigantopelta aegis]
MAQVINTNIYSLNAQRNLNNTSTQLATALQRLSSGLRINSAKDDAAGLAIASRFTAQIRGYNQGVRNAADAISLAQTAEGAYDELSNNLQRIRELAVQAANATNSSTDRQAIQTEISDLKAEINRVTFTQFNGVEVICADAGSFYFQVGPNGVASIDGITINTVNVRANNGFLAMQGTSATVYTANAGAVANTGAALSLIGRVDNLLQVINTQRAILGATQNRFESVIRNGENIAEQLSASRSRIQDADFAKETAALTKAQILQQAGTTVLSQANAVPQSVLSLLQG